MKSFHAVAALLLFSIGCASSAQSPVSTTPANSQALTPAGSHADEIAILDAYRADPKPTTAAPALALVSSNHDVVTMIPSDLLSDFLTGPGIGKDASATLLGGFIVGNARAQFVAGVKGDNFIEGIRGVLLFYQRLGLTTPTIEAAAVAEKNGELAAWAATWQSQHKDD